jgi:aspartate aminotransferase
METRSALNPNIAAIAPSATLAITERARALAAAGTAVCDFAAGEPDFDTPEPVKAAAAEALRAGRTKYTPASGLSALRAAIARKLRDENGLDYDPKYIVVSNGGKQAIFNVVMALCAPGDEVVIPAPYWLSYPEMVRVAGGTAVFAPAREANGFKLTPGELRAVLTPRAKALILNSPSNPVGLVYTEDELRALAEVAVEHDLTILSDEIYETMVYDEARHVSVGALSPEIFARTVTLNGFSKAFSMTGWRLGYAAGPAPLMQAVAALQSHSTSGPNTFAQYGALEALRQGAACTRAMTAAFAERRSLLYGRLARLPGVTCVKPLGAFYMLPNIAACGLDALTFATRLLEEQAVAVVPGDPFGAAANVRLSYACGTDMIEDGMDRIERFIATL